MKNFEETINILTSLRRHYYVAQNFTISLAALTLRVYSMDENGSPAQYFLFRGVHYMQMPTMWQDSPIRLATKEECYDYIERTGIEFVGSYIPYLILARPIAGPVNILFSNVFYSDTDPSETGIFTG
jgi:hypothetical protein